MINIQILDDETQSSSSSDLYQIQDRQSQDHQPVPTPLDIADQTTLRIGSTHHQHHQLITAQQHRRVLIVDDEPYNVLGLQLTISRLGIKGLVDMVDRAYNG